MTNPEHERRALPEVAGKPVAYAFPEAPPKSVFPVLGATPGVIGTMEAVETLKYLAGVGKNLKNRLLVWSGGDMELKSYQTRKDPECPACGSGAPPVLNAASAV